MNSGGKKNEILTNPNGKYESTITADNESKSAFYQLSYDGKLIVSPSKLGLMLEGEKVLGENLIVSKIENSSVSQNWKPKELVVNIAFSINGLCIF